MIAPTASIKQWIETGLSFVYPEICQVCRREHAIAREGYVCAVCWQKVRFIKSPFCKRCGLPYEGEITMAFECTNCRELELNFKCARSAVVAGGLVRDVIHRYKYNGARWFEPFLADLLLRESLPALAQQRWDLIAPVPLHSTKRREREFNQAERLAAHLSQASRIPLNTKLLKKVVPTVTQTALSRKERAANVLRAFALRQGASLRGERVVLVDDVFTTGATTNACAKVLMSAGAGEVCVWTVARGL